MKKYLNREDFVDFVGDLEVDKTATLCTESIEDGSISEYDFLRKKFGNNEIVLYDTYYGCTGIIQDTPMGEWEDVAEAVYDDFECEGEYKLFV